MNVLRKIKNMNVLRKKSAEALYIRRSAWQQPMFRWFYAVSALLLVFSSVSMVFVFRTRPDIAQAAVPAPTISSLSSTSGGLAGGNTLTITGSNFDTRENLSGVSVGTYHSCGIGDGKVYCWGGNSRGQLGDGTTTQRLNPVTASAVNSALAGKMVMQLAAGERHTCALTSDGKVYCWGKNTHGQLGDGTTTDRYVPTEVGGLLAGKMVMQVIASQPTTDTNGIRYAESSMCAVTNDGNIYCWGDNQSGQLGDGTTTMRTSPVMVVKTGSALSGKTVTQIAMGDAHTCARATDNKAYCWGKNGNGQIGDGTTTDSSLAVAVRANFGDALYGKTVLDVATGFRTSCARTNEVRLYCWGNNGDGQLGDGTTTSRTVPTAVVYASGGLQGKTVSGMSMGASYICAYATDGTTYCWGKNGNGQIGDGTTTNRTVPTAVVYASGGLQGKSVTEVDTNNGRTCVRTTDSRVYCWGNNGNGQIGDGTTTDRYLPTATAWQLPAVSFGRSPATNISLVSSTQLQVTTPPHAAGSVDVSVINPYTRQSGTLANGYAYTMPVAAAPTISSVSPASGSVDGGTTVTLAGTNLSKGLGLRSIAGGMWHTCGISIAQKAYCWGYNGNGQLGDGTTTQRTNPLPVATSGVLSGKNITQIAAGKYSTCALSDEGKAYCWGSNSRGQLGDGTTTQRTTPVEVGGALSGKIVVQIATSQPNTNATNHSTWHADSSTCAITSEGLVYCWGDNKQGQLGDGTTTQRNSPVAVDMTGALASKKVVEVSMGNSHACALTSEGLVYCWGRHQFGSLGLDNTWGEWGNYPTPTAVQMDGITLSSVGGYATGCGLASDGRVYCWGSDGDGQLGNDEPLVSSTAVYPVDTSGVLSGKTVVQISMNGARACALTSDNQLYCWGNNGDGQLGDGTTTQRPTPVAVVMNGAMASKTIVQVSTGYWHSCALASDGSSFCWGDNSDGQLGDGTTTPSTTPVAILPLPSAISFGGTLATNISLVSDTQMTMSTPAHTVGAVNVSLARPDSQTAGLTNGYSYFAPASAPQSLIATPAANGVSLTWNIPATDNGSAITDYAVQYCAADCGNEPSWQTFAHAPSTATSRTVTGLDADTTYTFRVAAVNSAGQGTISNLPSARPIFIEVSADGTVGLTITPSGGNRISSKSHTLTTTTNNPTGYTIQMGINTGTNPARLLTHNTLPANTFANSSLLPSAPGALATNTWGYRVDGRDSFGTSTTTEETNQVTSTYTWAGIPSIASSTLIRSHPTAINNQPTTVWYAINSSASAAPGNYQATVTYTAVAQD